MRHLTHMPSAAKTTGSFSLNHTMRTRTRATPWWPDEVSLVPLMIVMTRATRSTGPFVGGGIPKTISRAITGSYQTMSRGRGAAHQSYTVSRSTRRRR